MNLHNYDVSIYVGQMIDGPQNGTAPGPWDIAASPPSLFQDYVQHFEVPHTASVKVKKKPCTLKNHTIEFSIHLHRSTDM